MVVLEDLSELYRGPLKLPGGIEDTKEDTLLIKFSPNLEVVFIGNLLLRTMVPDAEPILLPIARLYKPRLEPGLNWTCSFSACSAYVVLAYNPAFPDEPSHSSSPDHPAQLHIFRFNIGDRKYTRCNTRAVSLSQYDKRTIDFHPYLPELVLNSFASPINYNKSAEMVALGTKPAYTIDDFKITTQLLDLEKETAITLESPTVYGGLKSGEWRTCVSAFSRLTQSRRLFAN